MYESFFGLSQRPFPAAPVARRYFPGTSIDAARAQLLRCLQRGEGPALIVGGPGLGKTLLLLVVADQLQEQFPVALLTSGLIRSRKELLQTLLEAVGEDDLLGEEADLRLRLTRRLSRDERFQRGVLLLVDEAHTLEPPLLDELRMLTNLAREGEPVVRLVLAGTMRLEEHVSLPELESLNQRLALRCYLECFDKAETADYVRFELAVSGGQAEHVFQSEAYEAIYQATDGVPRLINQVCDHALLLAQARGVKPVPATLIQEAWAQLQQLPTPWTEPQVPCSGGESAAAVIEFGSLEDEGGTSPAAEDESPQAQDTQEPSRQPCDVGDEEQCPAPATEIQSEEPAAASCAGEALSAEEPCSEQAPSCDSEKAAASPSQPCREQPVLPPAGEPQLDQEAPAPESGCGEESATGEEADKPPVFSRGSLDIQLTLEQIDQTWQQLLGESDEAESDPGEAIREPDAAPAEVSSEPPASAEASVEEPAADESPTEEHAAAEPAEDATAVEPEPEEDASAPVAQAAPPQPAEAQDDSSPESSSLPGEEPAECLPAECFEEEIIEDLYAALDAREQPAEVASPAGQSPAECEADAGSPAEDSPAANAEPAAVEPSVPEPETREPVPGEGELQVHLSGEQVQVVVDPYAGLSGPGPGSPETCEHTADDRAEPHPAEEFKLPLSQALREEAAEEAMAEASGTTEQSNQPESAVEAESPELEAADQALPELEISSGIVLIDEEEEEEAEALDVWPIPKDQLAEAFEQLEGRAESESS